MTTTELLWNVIEGEKTGKVRHANGKTIELLVVDTISSEIHEIPRIFPWSFILISYCVH